MKEEKHVKDVKSLTGEFDAIIAAFSATLEHCSDMEYDGATIMLRDDIEQLRALRDEVYGLNNWLNNQARECRYKANTNHNDYYNGRAAAFESTLDHIWELPQITEE